MNSERLQTATEPIVEPAHWRQISLTASMVGGDFGMRVKLGEVGEGNFFDPDRIEITLDRGLVMNEPLTAEFVAAHEGAHRAITGHPKDAGLKADEIKHRYQELGYASTQNYIEDPAVNNWLRQEYPGLRSLITTVYDGEFANPAGVMVTPEAQQTINRLGRIPYFVQFGTEQMRRWHNGEYRADLPTPVMAALLETQATIDEVITTLPAKGVRRANRVQQAFAKRYRTIDHDVWPVVQRLVELDCEIGQLQEAKQRLEQHEQAGGSVSQALKDQLEQQLADLQSGEQAGSLWDRFGESEQAELTSIIQPQLEQEWQEALKQLVEQLLNTLEQALNVELEAQLVNENNDPANGQNSSVDSMGVGRGASSQPDQAEPEFQPNLSHHEQVRREVRPEIESLYHSLLRAMRPDQFSDVTSGHASGSNPDLIRLMQAEVDAEQLNRIWERESEPQQRDFRFFHLVDTSGSMSSYLPAVHAGLVVTTEAIGRMESLSTSDSKIRQAVAAFDSAVHPIKNLNERQSLVVEEKLSALAKHNGGSTLTATGTNFGLAELARDLGRSGNFLLTYTDGDTGEKSELLEIMEQGRLARQQQKIKLGLIWVCPGVTPEMLEQHCRYYGYDFGVALPVKGSLKQFSLDLSDSIAQLMQLNI